MHKIRVMSYNIHSSRDDLGALARVVRSEAPDLVLAQEMPRRFRWRPKTARLARDWDLMIGGGGLWACGNTALTNLRVRVHETWDVRFPLTPGRHLRGAVFVRCSVGHSRFVAVGTHLSLDATERASQALELKSQLDAQEDPVLLCGDFNEESGGAGWRTLVDGLVDAAQQHGGSHLNTFSCAAPERRIDGVFVDPRIEVLAYRVVDTPEARSASDHFAVVADLALP